MNEIKCSHCIYFSYLYFITLKLLVRKNVLEK